MKRWYITGTDTEIGKTRVSCQLLRNLRQSGYRTQAYKPVAAGAERIAKAWRNADALELIQASGSTLPYAEVNPWCFQEAVAPHFLASEAGVSIEPEKMAAIVKKNPADIAIIEGVGGWLAPLDARHWQSDMVRALGAGVILVVGLRLGCINHALLSADRIRTDGLPLLGWVANQVDINMHRLEDNVATIEQGIDAPLLASIAWQESSPSFALAGLT